jgi:putative transposase
MIRNKKLSKNTKRNMVNLASYKFQQRLKDKLGLKQCVLNIVNESFTSQTCGYCGNLNKTKNEFIKCSNCKEYFDRDINGARNIYLKYSN